MKELSRPVPGFALARIALEWALILGVVLASEWSSSWLVYAIALPLIGARQHALAVLAHDGVHGLLHPRKRLNDAVGRALLAWPVLIDFDAYRRVHLQHHRHLNTDLDPDWARNRFGRLAGERPGALRVLRLLLGVGGRQRDLLEWFVRGDTSPRLIGALRAGFYTALLAAFVAGGGLRLLALYWLLPLATFFLLGMRLKGISEHLQAAPGDAIGASRTILHGPLARLFLFPGNAGYHVEHHLYPGVPQHRLPALHAELMRDPAFARQAPIFRGYLSFLRALARGPAAAPTR